LIHVAVHARLSSFVSLIDEFDGGSQMDSKKLLSILRAAGVVVGAAASTAGLPSASATAAADLEQTLLSDPTGQYAPDAFMQLAAKFKDKGDHGRPDKFGNPGPPEIGPPGHYGG
jgi:hypothetical protein